MKLLNAASANSFWKGINYHHENRVLTWQDLGKNCYKGTIKGSGDAIYNVTIDLNHPRRSKCDCPFADGRYIVCKHMVALDLTIFPEKEKAYMDYIDECNREYELEYERRLKKRKKEIKDYVMSLNKKQLQEKLLEHMYEDLYDCDRY